MKNNFKVIGVMSGTSLDGLDIAFCEFAYAKKRWEYKLSKATVVPYPRTWRERLASARQLSGEGLVALDADLGVFIGKACRKFIDEHRYSPDFISSHGHTVFHQPSRRFTTQIGNGTAIHATTGLPVICDFRSLDVLLGGEGAPLVPVGDRLLFSEYDICLNIGGIANLSAEAARQRVAYDVCFANMALNELMKTTGKDYDRGGQMSSRGQVNEKLLTKLRKMYQRFARSRPSLGAELYDAAFAPIVSESKLSLEDKLATVTESIAMEIAAAAKTTGGSSMLCTGGGAFNSFLMSRILEHCGDEVSPVIPEEDVVKFKEALVFAFLGVLRYRGDNNCLKSVTGAARDSSGGVMIGF